MPILPDSSMLPSFFIILDRGYTYVHKLLNRFLTYSLRTCYILLKVAVAAWLSVLVFVCCFMYIHIYSKALFINSCLVSIGSCWVAMASPGLWRWSANQSKAVGLLYSLPLGSQFNWTWHHHTILTGFCGTRLVFSMIHNIKFIRTKRSGQIKPAYIITWWY